MLAAWVSSTAMPGPTYADPTRRRTDVPQSGTLTCGWSNRAVSCRAGGWLLRRRPRSQDQYGISRMAPAEMRGGCCKSERRMTADASTAGRLASRDHKRLSLYVPLRLSRRAHRKRRNREIEPDSGCGGFRFRGGCGGSRHHRGGAGTAATPTPTPVLAPPTSQCAPAASCPAAATTVPFWSIEARCAIVPAGPGGVFGAENFGNKFPGEAAVYLGIVHVAIYDAAVAIAGGLPPVRPRSRSTVWHLAGGGDRDRHLRHADRSAATAERQSGDPRCGLSGLPGCDPGRHREGRGGRGRRPDRCSGTGAAHERRSWLRHHGYRPRPPCTGARHLATGATGIQRVAAVRRRI